MTASDSVAPVVVDARVAGDSIFATLLLLSATVGVIVRVDVM